MQKVLVLGCAGSGKSTFSKRLGVVTNLPVIHLDALYWKSGWVASAEEEWDRTIEELLRRDAFIMDGNFSRTLEQRLAGADTVFFFDLPRWLCIYRVIKRRVMYHGKTRADMAEGCKEKIDFKFLKWIWNFKKRSREKIVKTLEQAQSDKEIHIFKSTKEAEAFIANWGSLSEKVDFGL